MGTGVCMWSEVGVGADGRSRSAERAIRAVRCLSERQIARLRRAILSPQQMNNRESFLLFAAPQFEPSSSRFESPFGGLPDPATAGSKNCSYIIVSKLPACQGSSSYQAMISRLSSLR